MKDTPSSSNRTPSRVLFMALIAFNAARYFAPAGIEFWGLNFFRFLPDWLNIMLITLSVIAAFPPVARAIHEGVECAATIAFGVRRGNAVAFDAAVTIGVGIFVSVIFIKYPFFTGDGVHIIRRLFRYNQAVISSLGQLWTEPLTVLLYSSFTKIFASTTSTTGSVQLISMTSVFQTIGHVLGALYTFILLRLARRLDAPPIAKLALVSLMLGTAGVVFFFGYVEYYTPLFVLGSVFLLVGFREASMDGFPKWSLALVLLAIAFHLSAVVMLPAMLFLISRRRRAAELDLSERRRLASIITLSFIALIGLYLFIDAVGVNRFFIPLRGSESSWSLFHPQHLLDVIQNLLLHGGFALLLLVATIHRTIRKWNTARVFLAINAIFWLALIIAHSAVAPDWDVYALLGPSLALLAWMTLRESEPANDYLTTQSIIQPILLVLPFLLVQISFIPSLEKYQAIAQGYEGILPARVVAGYHETLRGAFSEMKDHEAEIAIISRTIELRPEPYEFYKLTRAVENATSFSVSSREKIERSLATILSFPDSLKRISVGEDEHSRRITLSDIYRSLVKATERHLASTDQAEWASSQFTQLEAHSPLTFEDLNFIANRYFAEQRYTDAITWYQRALSKAADNQQGISMAYNRLGIAFIKSNDEAHAIDALRHAVRCSDASAITWSDYGYACFTLGKFTEARPALERALRLDSLNANALYSLGLILSELPTEQSQSLYLLQKFLTLESNSPRAHQLRTSLGALPSQ